MRKFIVSLCIMCVVVSMCATVSAENTKTLDFSVQSLSEEEKTGFIQKTKLKMIYDDSDKKGIKTFDISENGTIALALGSNADNNINIYVYDPKGNFQYGYNFYSDGAYGIGFVEENIAIYFLRGDTIAIFDPNGNCIDVQKIINPDECMMLSKNIINRVSKQETDKSYLLERDVNIGDTYSRFVILEEDGTRNVLYDISQQHSIGNILWIVGIVGFFGIVIVGIVKKQRSTEENE